MSTPTVISFWRSMRAVAWSFFGIRKSSASQQELTRVNPFHVILAGLILTLALVLGLVALVRWVTAG